MDYETQQEFKKINERLDDLFSQLKKITDIYDEPKFADMPIPVEKVYTDKINLNEDIENKIIFTSKQV